MRAFTSALILVLGATAAAGAQPPAAASGPDLLLAPQHGPWMLYVSSFRGDDAEAMARELVDELRSRYKLPAYLYNRSDQLRQQRDKQLDEMRKLYGDAPLKKERVVDEWAVMVGHYKDMDAARKGLDKLKELPPPESAVKPQLFMADRDKEPGKKPASDSIKARKKIEVNPLRRAFVVPNPLAQRPAETAASEDWSKLNAGEKYSLLSCKKPWTLVVKVFNEPLTVTPPPEKASVFSLGGGLGRSSSMFGGKEKNRSSAESDARALAESLRRLGPGYEAYVLHTGPCSIVTVGGFDAKDDKMLQELQRRLTNMPVGSVKLDTPTPFQVPKAKIR